MKNLLAAALLCSLLLNIGLLLGKHEAPPPGRDLRLSVSLTASPDFVEPGGDIKIACALHSGAASPNHWIGLYAIGAHVSNHLGYHMIASLPATFTFKAPRRPGEYEVRYILEDNRSPAAASNSVRVRGNPPSRPVVDLQPGATLVQRGQEVQASWSLLWGERSTDDWIAFFAPGAKNDDFLAWQYIADADSGRVTLRAPEEPGTYEMRYLLNNGYESVAVSARILVVP